ncbi:MAG: DUF1016 family protein [Proteobacteria bacterium]|nr:DUF1016 family protein [Pseudomonadota bacterium]
MTDLTREEEDLYRRVAEIIEAARSHVARSVNTAMVNAYWHVGRELVEVEQHGKVRADYGERLVAKLAKRLSERFGGGMGVATLRRIRRFYLTYPSGTALPSDVSGLEIRSTALIESPVPEKRSAALIESATDRALFPPALGWSHYLVLIRVQDNHARAFYEIEAAKESWSVRELERQVASLLFERLAKSRNKDEVLALAKQGQTITAPKDVVKDPFVLEFLDLQERSAWLERDLEQAIIDRLESFLLELGKGFCFVARQRRLTLAGDHFYVDLVFYNRLLRCFVLIDLKLGKLTHQDLGQMQMYVNYFDRHQREEHEAPTVGIVLCSDKNDAMVKITLPEHNHQVHASRYQLYLPTEEELREELEREREEAERTLRLAASETDDGEG